jgi:hypothetical protein
MSKQYELSQQDIIVAIESTTTMWKDLTKDNLVHGNIMCPLCNLVRTVYRLTLHKGSARGACLLCPVKHLGLFHICVGIQHVYKTSSTTEEDMKTLRKTVLDNLKLLQKEINKPKTFNDYTAKVLEARRSMILGQQTGRIKRNVKEVITKPKRIFKVNRE